MCGRFGLAASGDDLAELLELGEVVDLAPRYNIAPTQQVAAVRLDDGHARRLVSLRWGLIPRWAKDMKIGTRLINARAETVAEKPAFRSAFRRRRCVVPADGFYEWKKLGRERQPHHIGMADGKPFGIAGLWESWSSPEGERIESCTLLTTEANEVVAPLHDRMPVILHEPDFAAWLDPASAPDSALTPLLRPFEPEAMVAWPVSPYVGKVSNEGPACRERLLTLL